MLGRVVLMGRLLIVRPRPGGSIAAGTVSVCRVATLVMAVPVQGEVRATGLDGGVAARLVADLRAGGGRLVVVISFTRWLC